MIAKVCARESRRDSWFEDRLVKIAKFEFKVIVGYGQNAHSCDPLVVYGLIQHA